MCDMQLLKPPFKHFQTLLFLLTLLPAFDSVCLFLSLSSYHIFCRNASLIFCK